MECQGTRRRNFLSGDLLTRQRDFGRILLDGRCRGVVSLTEIGQSSVKALIYVECTRENASFLVPVTGISSLRGTKCTFIG